MDNDFIVEMEDMSILEVILVAIILMLGYFLMFIGVLIYILLDILNVIIETLINPPEEDELFLIWVASWIVLFNLIFFFTILN